MVGRETMKIKLKRNCLIHGVSYEAGNVVETDGKTADYIIAIGKAERLDGKEEKPKAEKAAPKSKPLSTKNSRELVG